jgi:hypothetical protein
LALHQRFQLVPTIPLVHFFGLIPSHQYWTRGSVVSVAKTWFSPW